MQKFEYRVPRFAVDLPVSFAMESSLLIGRCTEISKEGMKVEFEQPLPADTRGKVSMNWHDGVLELKAKVAHVGPNHSGLKFLCESDEERDAVADLVSTLAHAQNPAGRLI
jgi:PilZ domain